MEKNFCFVRMEELHKQSTSSAVSLEPTTPSVCQFLEVAKLTFFDTWGGREVCAPCADLSPDFSVCIAFALIQSSPLLVTNLHRNFSWLCCCSYHLADIFSEQLSSVSLSISNSLFFFSGNDCWSAWSFLKSKTVAMKSTFVVFLRLILTAYSAYNKIEEPDFT